MKKDLSTDEALQIIKHLEIPIDLTNHEFWLLRLCLKNQIEHLERESGWKSAVPYEKLLQRIDARLKDFNLLLVVDANEHGHLHIAIITYIRYLHGMSCPDLKALLKKLDELLDRALELAIATNYGEQQDIGEI